ncbi:hypothetical protein MMC30_005931 [Trapelia coarctata]|nr:hypothetical protein [Trapelia coarctata]
MATKPASGTKPSMENLNDEDNQRLRNPFPHCNPSPSSIHQLTSPFPHLVFQKPLALFSQKPMTGFYRDGYCRVGPEDSGNHAIAATLTDAFLDFSASRGNNLRSIGLTSGCKWCLCTSRWKEAVDAAASAEDPVVPKVFLHATDQSALDRVSLADLKKFAAEGEAGGVGGRTPGRVVPEEPEKRGGLARETH